MTRPVGCDPHPRASGVRGAHPPGDLLALPVAFTRPPARFFAKRYLVVALTEGFLQSFRQGLPVWECFPCVWEFFPSLFSHFDGLSALIFPPEILRRASHTPTTHLNEVQLGSG